MEEKENNEEQGKLVTGIISLILLGIGLYYIFA